MTLTDQVTWSFFGQVKYWSIGLIFEVVYAAAVSCVAYRLSYHIIFDDLIFFLRKCMLAYLFYYYYFPKDPCMTQFHPCQCVTIYHWISSNLTPITYAGNSTWKKCACKIFLCVWSTHGVSSLQLPHWQLGGNLCEGTDFQLITSINLYQWFILPACYQ